MAGEVSDLGAWVVDGEPVPFAHAAAQRFEPFALGTAWGRPWDTVWFDVRGEVSKSIQCLETTCGDPDGVTDRGGIIYTGITRPRLIGLRVGRKF